MCDKVCAGKFNLLNECMELDLFPKYTPIYVPPLTRASVNHPPDHDRLRPPFTTSVRLFQSLSSSPWPVTRLVLSSLCAVLLVLLARSIRWRALSVPSLTIATLRSVRRRRSSRARARDA